MSIATTGMKPFLFLKIYVGFHPTFGVCVCGIGLLFVKKSVKI